MYISGSQNVLFCQQHKDIPFTLIEEETYKQQSINF